MAEALSFGKRVLGGAKTSAGPEKDTRKQITLMHERLDRMDAAMSALQSENIELRASVQGLKVKFGMSRSKAKKAS